MKPTEASAATAPGGQSGFSRVDALATIVILALLAITLLPALARTHVQPQGTQCLYNLRQLTQAWWMYVNDNNGRMTPNRSLFPPNPDYQPPSGNSNRARWVGGDMRGGTVEPPYTGMDATNTALLANPAYTALAPYVKEVRLYHCPADHSTWGTGGPGVNELPRVRSYSMNCAVGTAYNGTEQDPGHQPIDQWLYGAGSPGPWRTYRTTADLVAPKPSELMLLVDEHPNSINDATFAFAMPPNPVSTRFIDIPTDTHNNAGNFSFMDGHVETHRWVALSVFPPVVWAADLSPNTGNVIHGAPNDPDVLWMAHRVTAPLSGQNVYYP